MALLKTYCSCGSIVLSNVGEKADNEKLYWYQSYHCDNCGETMEIDCEGIAPEVIRNSILESDGYYSLYIKERKDRGKVVFLLKKWKNFLELGLEDFLKQNTERIICGTQSEVMLVKDYLKRRGGIECIIE